MTIQHEFDFYSSSDMRELFKHDAQFVLDFVIRSFSGEISPEKLEEKKMFWYSIASTAATETFKPLTKSKGIDISWARVANTTFGYLSGLSGGSKLSWMQFKVGVINNLGTEANSDLATSDEVVHWFLDSLFISLDEAKDILRLKPEERISSKDAELLSIFEKAKVVSHLIPGEHFQRSEELEGWLSLLNLGNDQSSR